MEHAQQVATTLLDVAATVGKLAGLGAHNHVSIAAARFGNPPEIDVHGCTPEQLDSYTTLESARAHRDEDQILKYVSLDYDGCAVTFYRR